MDESTARRATFAFALAALAALFFALAVPPTGVGALKKNSVKSKQIKNGEVKTDDLGDLAVTMAKLAQNAVGSANVVDDGLTGADIDEGQLDANVLQRRITTACALGQFIRSVDASGNAICADDQVGGTTATDVNCAGACVSDGEVADTITVGSSGIVSDAALSANVAKLDTAQTFAAANTFTADVSYTFSDAEQASVQLTTADNGSNRAVQSTVINTAAGGLDTAGRFVNSIDSTETLDAGVVVFNGDNDVGDGMVDGVQVNGLGSNTITDALDVSSAAIDNALSIGTNDIVTAGAEISSTELDRLDGKDAALVDQNDSLASLKLDAQTSLGTCDATTVGTIAYKNPAGDDNDAFGACVEGPGATFQWIKFAGDGVVP